MKAALSRVKDSPFLVSSVLLFGFLAAFILTRGFGGWSAQVRSFFSPLSVYNCADSSSITVTLENTNTSIDYSGWEDFVALVERRRENFQSAFHSDARYRVAMCTITRNELHLKEWLIRNTLLGFEHFFLYDTNQIDNSQDIDIRATIRPFQNIGLITHVRVPSNVTKGPVSTAEKNIHINNCLHTYGYLTEWLAYFDSDEMVHISASKMGELTAAEEINPLYHMLETTAAAKLPNPPGVYIRWALPYPEAQVLKPKKLLLDAYPRACIEWHELGKNIVRPSRVQVLGDHTLEGQWSTDVSAETVYLSIIHYYSKSVEEFLVKKEQSWTEFERLIVDAYDWSKWRETCSFEPFDYFLPYVNMTRRVMESMRKIPDAGVALTAPWQKALRKGKDWNLYIFLKWIVAMRYEWDERSYLELHSDVSEKVRRQELTDGWWHFISKGFAEEYDACWRTQDGQVLCF